MKIKGEFIRRNVAGEILLVPVGQTALDFNGMITMTESADLIWSLLEKEKTREEILQKLLEEYDIDEETARADLDSFLNKLTADGFLEN